MSWDDIHGLASAGMDIGSNTRTCRVLETLDYGDLCSELIGSRRDLEEQLGRPVRALAYPVGRRLSVRVRRAVIEAGYCIGLTNYSGVNRVWPGAMRSALPIDRFDIRRLPTERSLSDAMFLTQIAVPQLAFGHG